VDEGASNEAFDVPAATYRHTGDEHSFRLLLEFAAVLNSEIDDIELVYRETLLYLSKAIDFQTASVQVLNDRMVKIVASIGFSDPKRVDGLEFPLDERFPNYEVVDKGRPLRLADIRAAYPHFEFSSGEYASGHIRSWLGVPLMTRDDVVGMITLDRTTVTPFSDSDVDLVVGFAAHVASAIRNAHLYRELERANHTKDVLLQELHHRVKNNMQLVSSLLNLRSANLQPPEARRVLQELQTKVAVLADVHDRLYDSLQTGVIDIGEYTAAIVRSVVNGYAPVPSKVSLKVQTASIDAGLDTAIPHGLIVSELVLNAAKYAVDGEGRLNIVVSLLQKGDRVRCTVGDDGPGMAPDFELNRCTTFGMTMVASLVSQLRGDITIGREAGTTWMIEYPLGPAGRHSSYDE
jgi:two-component sensor histidine kinase